MRSAFRIVALGTLAAFGCSGDAERDAPDAAPPSIEPGGFSYSIGATFFPPSPNVYIDVSEDGAFRGRHAGTYPDCQGTATPAQLQDFADAFNAVAKLPAQDCSGGAEAMPHSLTVVTEDTTHAWTLCHCWRTESEYCDLLEAAIAPLEGSDCSLCPSLNTCYQFADDVFRLCASGTDLPCDDAHAADAVDCGGIVSGEVDPSPNSWPLLCIPELGWLPNVTQEVLSAEMYWDPDAQPSNSVLVVTADVRIVNAGGVLVSFVPLNHAQVVGTDSGTVYPFDPEGTLVLPRVEPFSTRDTTVTYRSSYAFPSPIAEPSLMLQIPERPHKASPLRDPVPLIEVAAPGS